MRTLASAALVAIAASACLKNPAVGVSPTGEPARLKITSGVDTITVYEPGYSYRDKIPWKNWDLQQGNRVVDEQDWYSLTDPKVAAELKAKRARWWRHQKLGVVMWIGGYVLAGVSLKLYDRDKDKIAETPLDYAALAGLITGTVASLVGPMYLFGGRLRMAQPHVLPMERAYQAAEEVQQCRASGHCRITKSKLGMR